MNFTPRFLCGSTRAALLLAIVTFLTLIVPMGYAQEGTMLPFGVSVGGQKAVLASKDAIFAKVPAAVAADAVLEVEGDPQMLIINIFPTNAKGEVANGVQPAVILGQGTKTVKLSDTMDKQKLAPGIYLANIVDPALGTARLLFTVE